MSLSLRPEIEARLRARAGDAGVSVDDYVDRLIQTEDADVARTELALQEAIESGDYVELVEEEWDRMEQEALSEVAPSARPSS